MGTVANSCSTMHKITDKEFTLEDFSHEHLIDSFGEVWDIAAGDECRSTPLDILYTVINALNVYRDKYLEVKEKPMKDEKARQALMKSYWWQMIQLLPSSYNQRRTVMLNYEVLANIAKPGSRKFHKLDEWRVDFMNWIETLPYHELITGSDLTDLSDGKITMNEARARMGFPPIDMSAFPKHTMGMGPIPADLARDIGVSPRQTTRINLGPHEKAIVDQVVNDIAKGMGRINLDKHYGGNEE